MVGEGGYYFCSDSGVGRSVHAALDAVRAVPATAVAGDRAIGTDISVNYAWPLFRS
jgi:hypothetical protein